MSSDVCGHNYCEEFIIQAKREGHEQFVCPHSECEGLSIVPLTAIKRNRAMDRQIKNLRYSCPNRGCQESPKFSKVNEHISNDCQYTPVPCSKCKKMVVRRDKAKHEATCTSQACAFKDIGCEEIWQERAGTSPESQTEHHTGQHMALLIHRLKLEKEKRVVRPKDIKESLDKSEQQINGELTNIQ